MYRKILEKVANIGTVALLGYEIGSHVENESEKPITDNKVHTEIIIAAIILLLLIVVAITVKFLIKKRPIV